MTKEARKCCVMSTKLSHAPLKSIALLFAVLLMQMSCGLDSDSFWQKVIRYNSKTRDRKAIRKVCCFVMGVNWTHSGSVWE